MSELQLTQVERLGQSEDGSPAWVCVIDGTQRSPTARLVFLAEHLLRAKEVRRARGGTRLARQCEISCSLR